MALGVTIVIILAVVLLIYLFVEVKRLKHKMFALFLMGLIVFSYASAVAVFHGKNIDFSTVKGLSEGTQIYLSWLVNVGKNLGTVTANAIKLDWTKTEGSINITKLK